MEKLVLDNTKRSMFRSCKRKYYWNDVCGYKSNTGSNALRYGSTWHGIQDGFYNFIKKHGWEDKASAINAAITEGKRVWDRESAKQTFYPDYRTFEACGQSFLEYINFYKEDFSFLKIINTEQVFVCPIPIETEEEKTLYGHLPPITFTGKLDLQVEMSGMKWLHDHKTSGQDLNTQAARLNRSAQFLGYSYAGERVLDFKPDGCMVSLHQLLARKTKSGEYGNLTINFLRVPQIFTRDDILQWKLSFLDTCNELYYATMRDNFPMNFDSCYQFGACGFTRLCEQNRHPEETNTEGFHVDFWDVLDDE